MSLAKFSLTCALLGFVAAAPNMAAQPAVEFKDLAAHPVETPAINNMVSQGIMKPVGATEFAPDAAETLGEFVVSVHSMFNLGQPAKATEFGDVTAKSAIYAAVQAVTPYMGRQMLCFGCLLGKNLLPEQSISHAQVAMIMAQVLVAQKKLALPTAAETEAALANVADAGLIPPPARPYMAAALTGGIVTLQSGYKIALGMTHTRAEVAVIFDGAQKKFSLPQINQPR